MLAALPRTDVLVMCAAVADYRPGGVTGAHDMLQAALAQPLFRVQPETIVFLVAPADPPNPSQTVSLLGPDSYSWTAAAGAFWLNVSPDSGPITTQPAISLVTAGLAEGWQESAVTFTTQDGLNSTQVTVKAYYGTVEKFYLPLVSH